MDETKGNGGSLLGTRTHRIRSEREIREYLNRHEHDACALMAAARKDGVPSHQMVIDSLEALAKMVHRSGDVDGEGDGCGLQIDLPRGFWGVLLGEAGQDPLYAQHPRFAVGHFFIPRTEAYWAKTLKEQILSRLEIEGFEVLLQRSGVVNTEALGPRGQHDEPEFWQVACLAPGDDLAAVNKACYRMCIALEDETELHVLSFSADTVVYKVRGDARVLAAYYPDLRDTRLESRMAIGHNRYSTNTSTIFERVQPFSVLGHNGEINTIRQLREQARQLGIPLTKGGSDSQDLNRTLDGLIHQFGITLFEAMEMIFPPIIGEIKGMPAELQDLYMYYRQAWGPYAQGPAAIAARSGDYLVASVDAMGLRPFWQIETADTYFFSSEQGIVSIGEMVRDPHPLAPGEKVGVLLRVGLQPELLSYTDLQRRVLQFSRNRFPVPKDYRRHIVVGGPHGHSLPLQLAGANTGAYRVSYRQARAMEIAQERLLSAMGWSGEDLQQVRAIAASGAEPIGSLGYDGPLACLNEQRHNLSDYFKESVAVVTNPAVDREREIEHFSTRTVLGARPPVAMLPGWTDRSPLSAVRVELRLPVVLGGHRTDVAIAMGEYRDLARAAGTYLLEDLLAEFDPLSGAGDDPGVIRRIHTTFAPTESLAQALSRIARHAVSAVSEGAQLLVIDDALAFEEGNLFIDPHLILSVVDQALKQAVLPEGATNLRRRCSLVLRSGALRSLHDVALAIGMGADAVNPYLLLEVAAGEGVTAREGLENVVGALHKGLEKVISTIGIHELRGYARCYSHIGLKREVAKFFDCEGYCGSDTAGLSLARLKADAGERYRVARGEGKGELAKSVHFWPRLWKAVADAGISPAKYDDYLKRLHVQEKEMPVSLRHLLDFRHAAPPVAPDSVDVTIEDYQYPITISGMSFGSQSEIAFRAYAEAAKRLDIVCMNGEGGEIPDMVGKYFKWRGQQVASGRFGVHAEMLNGSRFIEIKVGQGAKPGEGGHLPGSKVSAKVARARNAVAGTDLISPSNNHDVYSIEDLAQLAEELKTTNPHAKIVVKIPVVPGVGTIAVGIAKSGADIVALCGYDGGTGAARKHALRHAGLPIEIGVREAHLALVAAGIRDRVEIWGDSGIKSGTDVVKLMLLGANRVGFATMAMVAIGCTICRGCQLDTCHVGIATQMETHEEAREKGLKSFIPRVYEDSVDRLVNLFTCVGEEVRRVTAKLGFARTQDLVGKAELLEQVGGIGRVDLAELILPVAWELPSEIRADRPPIRQCAPNHLTREIAAVAARGAFIRSGVTARDRILGTHLAGDIARARVQGLPEQPAAVIELTEGSVAGNGLAAFSTRGISLKVLGGAQDGVGKGMLGGRVIILKDRNRYGGLIGGSVGKSFAYGAQEGTFVVQGDADARCGIRLSGADLILGATLKGPLEDGLGSLGTRANLKGFAFEYMTRGRAVVLGDPGPWICSGMTGGVVYVRLQPEMGLDEAAIRRRLAKGAKVHLSRIGAKGKKDLTELLSTYHQVLLGAGRSDEAGEVLSLMVDCEKQFLAILPITKQVEGAVTTE
ncbi:MAG TPA: glutamate synthase-related protein [Symbiobacteriaceae bacterium]|nr:glutamate synthase-related protein [Symbiobacteriaceae bacterium]